MYVIFFLVFPQKKKTKGIARMIDRSHYSRLGRSTFNIKDKALLEERDRYMQRPTKGHRVDPLTFAVFSRLFYMHKI